MKEKLILEIVSDLKEKLSSEQIDCLKAVLNRRLLHYKISSKPVENDEESKTINFTLTSIWMKEKVKDCLKKQLKIIDFIFHLC